MPRPELSPHVFVVFGATGDLARRKLFPGLYRLAATDRLPTDYAVIGSGRHSPGSRTRGFHEAAARSRCTARGGFTLYFLVIWLSP